MIGSVAVSFGSIFVRLAAAPALAVAAYRVIWASLLLALPTARGPISELRSIQPRELKGLLLSGTALALHFSLWIASLSYTSVASSVLLVDTTPFFVGVASHWWLGRRHGRRFWTGLAVTFLGCAVIFSEDWSVSGSSLTGNLLAVGGAVAMAAYLLAGAAVRRRLSLLAYVWPVYALAAAVLTVACLAAGVPLRGYGAATHLYLFLLGMVPQCIGHTSYNWSLRWLPPGLVAIVTLAEPVGASLLAYLLLAESLTRIKLIGGAVILAGIYTATRPDPVQGGKNVPGAEA